jgi:cupin fold WbuC family metalloprotein
MSATIKWYDNTLTVSGSGSMQNLKVFDDSLLTQLKHEAQHSPRQRANLNVHNSYSDLVQRLFIAMYPDSYVRPHRHVQAHKWEFFMVVEGSIELLFFNEEAVLTKRITLDANGDCKAIEIPPNTWHATVCHAPVVFMEVKQGPYDVDEDKGFASWAPEEGTPEVTNFLARLKTASQGTCFSTITD